AGVRARASRRAGGGAHAGRALRGRAHRARAAAAVTVHLRVEPGLEGRAEARWTAAALLDLTELAWVGGDGAAGAGPAAERGGVVERPLLNELAAALERRLRAAAASRAVTLAPNPRWPDGARFAVALTHDVDEVRWTSWRDGVRLLALARGPRSYAFRAGLAM